MDAVRVLKFGGAALRDGPAVRRACGIALSGGDERPILVVSAHEGVTALLRRAAVEASRGRLAWDEVRIRHRTILRELDLPGDLLDAHLRQLRGVLGELARGGSGIERRHHDFVVSFGERMSARIVAAALRREGVPATPLDAFDLGLTPSSSDSDGTLAAPVAARVRRALRGAPGALVVTGFLALDAAGHVATLGRNGSDLTAVWIAAALGAHEVVFWKAVDGVLTADPRLVPEARPIRALDWERAAVLTAYGADVLHAGCIAPARSAGLRLVVRGFADPRSEGTLVGPGPTPAGPLALAHRDGLVRTSLDARELTEVHGSVCTPADALRALVARVDEAALHLAWTGPDGAHALCTTEDPAAGGERCATLTVVGSGVGHDAGLAARSLEVLASAGGACLPGPPSAGPDALSFVLSSATLPQAARALHAELRIGLGPTALIRTGG